MTEEVEIYEHGGGQEVVPYDHTQLVRAESPGEFVAKAQQIAEALVDVVEDRQLYATISGRKHPKVEAWTFLGSMMGAFGSAVYAVTEWTRPIEGDDGKIIGWEARVEARTTEGNVVGAAEAMCTRRESTWKNRDDYAIRSMAQTRATSKALRQPLGFLMELAGYNPTPKEEIEVVVPETASAEEVAGLLNILGEAEEIDARIWNLPSVMASASQRFGRQIKSLNDLTSAEVATICNGAMAWRADHTPVPTPNPGEEDIPFGE